MGIEEPVAEELIEIRQIGRALKHTLVSIYGPKSVLRNTVREVDFDSAVRRVGEFEVRLHELGAALFDRSCEQNSENLRLARAYWCQIFLAATSLSDGISHHENYLRGADLGFDRLAGFIERYHGAMKGARKIWKKLYPQKREEVDS